ncbi:MAG: RNA polymerase sigma factor region1.1 domain-containing protein, partial [Pseudomonadota bacterium]
MSDIENFETQGEGSNDNNKKQLAVLIKKLIARAKAQGFLTYDEVNGLIPKESAIADSFDYIISSLNDAGVNLVE